MFELEKEKNKGGNAIIELYLSEKVIAKHIISSPEVKVLNFS